LFSQRLQLHIRGFLHTGEVCKAGVMRMEDWFKREHKSTVHEHVQGPWTYFFHRPRILFLLLALLFLSPIVQCQDTDSSPTGATTVFATTTLTQMINTGGTLTTTTTTGASTLTMTTTTTAANGTATSTDSTSSVTLTAAANTSPITIPQPFDTAQLSGKGSNFTSTTCPQFMRTFLADPGFQACVPFSLLLYTSAAFITLTREVLFLCFLTDFRGHLQLVKSSTRLALLVHQRAGRL